MYHEQPPEVVALAKEQGKVYCPWREQFVDPPASQSAHTGPTRSLLEERLPSRNLLGSVLIGASAPEPRDYQRQFLVEKCAHPQESFLLQSPTGSGKTFTALYAAAQHLEQGQCVVFVVPTIDLMRQTFQEAQRLFGSDCTFVRQLSGESKAKRVAAYSDPRALLLIVTAPSAERDIASGALDLSNVGLLILDEGDLTRGEDPLARIARHRKHMPQPPPTIVMSATLTIADNPSERHPEVIALRSKIGIQRFIQLYPDRKSSYEIFHEKMELPEIVKEAARALQSDYWNRVETVHRHVEFLVGPEAERVQTIVAALRHGRRGNREFMLPSIKTLKPLAGALKDLKDALQGLGKMQTAQEMIRTSFEVGALSHMHELLVNTARVNFLEFAGQMLLSSRLDSGKPHHRHIFPPGRPPLWWQLMSRGTAYELLASVNSFQLEPLSRFLASQGIETRTFKEASEQFFSSGRALGAAAKHLCRLRFDEHPCVFHISRNLTGSARRNMPGQTLVSCATALEARYLAERLGNFVRESTVTLVGNKHTTSTLRKAAFELAKSGAATLAFGTSVVGRGVDLPHMTMLIDKNPDPDIRGAKQKFGRVGRMDKGLVITLATEGTSAEMYDIARRVKAESRGASFPERRVHRHRRGDNTGLLFRDEPS